MTDNIFLLVDSDIFRGHPIEIIVGRIVFAHMIEAEGKILSLTQSAHGRAEFARFVATWMIATHLIGLHSLFSFRLHPDAIEESRIQIHVCHYEALWGGRKPIYAIK
jgi:hypothetical protein